MKLKLSNGTSNYGAQMGRRNILPDNCLVPIKLQMEKLKWVDGDYDQNGAYWGGGNGDNIYCAHGTCFQLTAAVPFPQIQVFVRAYSRQEAKEKVRVILPNAKFYR